MSIVQSLNRVIKIFHFKRRPGSLIRRCPGVAYVRNRQRIISDGVFDPLSTHHFIGDLQSEHVFVKRTRSLNVRDRNCDKSNGLDFHFAVPEVPNSNSQISSNIQSPNPEKQSCYPLLEI